MARKILTSTASPANSNFHYYHLPKGMIKVSVTRTQQPGGRLVHNIVAAETVIPDPAHRYFFTYHANAFSDDRIDIQFSKDGFLKRIDTTMEDKTGAIVEAVVDAVAEVAKGAVGLRSLEGKEEQLFEETIDPFDEAAMRRLNDVMQAIGAGFEVALKPLHQAEETAAASEAVDPEIANRRFGVFCRPLEPYEFIVKLGDQERRQLLMLPHHQTVHFVEIPYANFVTNKFTMEFNEKGYPLSIHVEKPSQALAIIELPLRVLKAILEIPAQLFQFRINYNNQRVQTLQSEQTLQAAIQQKEANEQRLREELEQTKRAESEARNKLDEVEAEKRTLQARMANN